MRTVIDISRAGVETGSKDGCSAGFWAFDSPIPQSPVPRRNWRARRERRSSSHQRFMSADKFFKAASSRVSVKDSIQGERNPDQQESVAQKLFLSLNSGGAQAPHP